MMTTPEDNRTAIHALIERVHGAVYDKDPKAAVACLSDDAVAFDLSPPLQQAPAGSDGTGNLQQWFDTWQGPIRIEDRDMRIEADGDVAWSHALRHMTGTKTDGEAVDLWFRGTMCFRRSNGDWRVTHIHDSVPFAMDGSGRALLDLKP
jgi:ketosteroid isomerase-like protein